MANGDFGAAQLSQLARFLFDQAASYWWASRGLELTAGLLAVTAGLLEFTEDASTAFALLTAALLVAAYVLRLIAEQRYDLAETMRRQSVLSEGLGWKLDPWQRRRWIERASLRLRNRLSASPREDDYYASSAGIGPRRLAEMTVESAFYTRGIYGRVRHWAWIVFGAVGMLWLALVLFSGYRAVPDSWADIVSKAVFLTVPAVLGIDVLGWALRLGRVQDQICSVERDLRHFLGEEDLDEREVVRLVAEYNCQVVVGIPILGWMWHRWEKELEALWKDLQDEQHRV